MQNVCFFIFINKKLKYLSKAFYDYGMPFVILYKELFSIKIQISINNLILVDILHIICYYKCISL